MAHGNNVMTKKSEATGSDLLHYYAEHDKDTFYGEDHQACQCRHRSINNTRTQGKRAEEVMYEGLSLKFETSKSNIP